MIESIYTPYAAPFPARPIDWTIERCPLRGYVQPKINGVRALLSPDGTVYKKSGNVCHALSQQFGTYGVWLDGELLALDGLLSTTAGLANRSVADNETRQMIFYAFDIINPYVIFSARNALLLQLAYDAFGKLPICKVNTQKYDSLAAAEQIHELYASCPHYDGTIYRQSSAVYEFGKTPTILKRKRELDAEFLCIGVLPGEGKFAGMLGSFLCRTPADKTFACSGCLSNEDRERYWKNPELVVNKKLQVRFPYYSADNIPQCPQFVRVREDLDL